MHWVNNAVGVNSCSVLEGLVERSRDELEEEAEDLQYM